MKNGMRLVLFFCLLAVSVSVFGQIQSGNPWPQFQQNSRSTGQGLGAGSNGLLNWSASVGVYTGSPIVDSTGTVYVGSTDGNVYTFSPSGSPGWTYNVGGPVTGSLAIDNNGIVYGATSNQVFAIGPGGDPIWFGSAEGLIGSPAIGSDGTIYICSVSTVYAFTVGGSPGTPKWSCAPSVPDTPTAQFPDSICPAIGPNGVIYVAGLGGVVYGITPAGQFNFVGSAFERTSDGEGFNAGVSIGSDGTVYAASTMGNVYIGEPGLGFESPSFSYPAEFDHGPPAIGPDGTIYLASGDGVLYAIDPSDSQISSSAALKWTYNTGDTLFGSPSIGSDGTIYLAGISKGIYAISSSGTLLWNYNPSNQFRGSPAIGFNGVLYVASTTGNVFAIGTEVNTIAVASVSVNPASVVGGNPSTGTVTLSTAAPQGGDVVYLTSSDPSAVVPTYVTVAGGQTTASFTINTSGVSVNTTDTITATSGGVASSAFLTVTPAFLSSLILNPTTVVGGVSSIGTVTLNGQAPSSRWVVNLTSSSASVIVPSSVSVRAGETSLNFGITTVGTSSNISCVITARDAVTSQTATLNVNEVGVTAVALNPTTIQAQAASTGTVTLNGPAGPTGDVVSLSSSNTSAATMPANVTVAAGATSATFTLTSLSGSFGQTSTITATLNGTANATLTIGPADLSSVSVSPSTVIGGPPVTGTVTLAAAAPTGGYSVNLSSTSENVVVPATAFIAAGSTSATFTVTTSNVAAITPVTITASLGPTTTICVLTLQPIVPIGITAYPSTVVGGTQYATGTVVLNGPASSLGVVVSLSSSITAAASVPATVTIPSGATEATFMVATYSVASSKSVTLTGTALGVTVNATLTVIPTSLILAPWSMSGQNAQNSGQGLGGGSNGLLRWTGVSSGDLYFGSASIGSNGAIYVGGLDGGVFAFDSNGALAWDYSTGDSFFTCIPAIDSNGNIYLSGFSGNVYAFNLNSSLLWTYPAPDSFVGSNVVGSNGTIYAVGTQGGIYALNSSGGSLWSYQTGDSFQTSPAIGQNGVLYAAGQNGGIYALNSIGALLWSSHMSDSFLGAPTIGSDGTIYVSGSTSGELYAFNAIGALLWTYETPAASPGHQALAGSAAIGSNGSIYVGNSMNSVLYAISPNGSLLWSFQAASGIAAPPTLGSDGTVYILNGNSGDLYAISPSGNLLWTYAINDALYGSATIGSDGALYVTGFSGDVYAIGTQVNSVAVSGLSVNPTSVEGGSTSTGTVTLSSAAPSGGDVVSLTSSGPSGVVPGNVTVAAGQRTATFAITTNGVSVSTTVTVTAASSGASKSASLTVTPAALGSLTLNPTTILGGTSSTGTVTLNGPAPSGGTVVTLTNQWPAYVTVPATVTVFGGATSATFIVSTPQMFEVAFTDLITATYASAALNSTLTVSTYALQSVTLNPASVQAGTGSTGTLTLGGPAPAGGWTVYLTSANPTFVSVPASVMFAPGATSATFAVTTTTTAPTFACLISVHDSVIYRSATLNVTSDSITGLTLNPSSVGAGQPSTGTITLKSAAPAGGWTVGVSVGVPSIVTAPATVTVPAGATSATFTLTTKLTATTYNSGVYLTDGHSGANAVLTVVGNQVASLTLNPTTIGAGGTSTGTITLKTAALTGGWLVNLTVGIPSLLSLPASVTVPAGATTVTFSIVAKATGTSYTSGVYASDGNSAASANLTILGDVLTSLTLSPTMIGAGGTSSGTVTLKTAAPSGGWLVKLSAGIPSLVTMPATVTVPAGSTTVTFSIVGKATGTTYTTGIYATDGNSAASANLTIQGDVILSVSVSPTSVVGGTGATGTVTLKTAAPPGGWLVTLSSAVPSVLGVPATVLIPAGQTSATFPITTTTVTSTLNIGVYASDGNSGGSAVLVVTG